MIGGDVPAGAYGDAHERQIDAEETILVLPEPHPVIIYFVVPVEKLHHQLHPLARPHGRDTEKLADIDNADTPYLEEVPDHLRGLAHQFEGPIFFTFMMSSLTSR